MAKLTTKAPGQPQANATLTLNVVVTPPPEITIKREFRINGQIGDRGQRDKLSFSNLIHQIDMGLKRNPSKAEIIEAVVRAVSPGPSLHDMSDLTLLQLHTIQRGITKKTVQLTCTTASKTSHRTEMCHCRTFCLLSKKKNS